MRAGRELDALIGEKIMGRDMTKPKGFKYPMYLPHYSTDIAAAWRVVEHFRDKKASFRQACFELEDEGETTEFGRGTWRATFLGRHHRNGCACGETAPEAICLAALVMVGVEVPA